MKIRSIKQTKVKRMWNIRKEKGGNQLEAHEGRLNLRPPHQRSSTPSMHL